MAHPPNFFRLETGVFRRAKLWFCLISEITNQNVCKLDKIGASFALKKLNISFL